MNGGNELIKYAPELGGNAVFVVMDDCDIDLAAKLSLGAFENSGQRCTAIRRILLHRDIYDDFIERFVQLTSQIKYGDPLNPENDMGTVISAEQANLIHQRVNKAVNEGAILLTGNKIDNALYSPTIVHNVNSSSELVKDETFGPVVSLRCFDSEDDLLEKVHQTGYGLAGSIFSKDKKRIKRILSQLKIGNVSINDVVTHYGIASLPFGGEGLSG